MLDGSRPPDELAEEVRDRASRAFLSRPRRGACSTPRSPRGRRTRTSSTGPPGVGKRRAALGFAGELLGDPGRVERRAHPDLYVLEPLGDQIRIDAIRELRHDLHMRPFEADRRVYLIFGAHTLNDEAADALLKDLEEPPPYAVVVLVADDLGPLPETIRSRCQLVPFRRLAEKPSGRRSPRARRSSPRRRRPRWPGSPAGGSTGSTGCSTRRRRSGAMRCSRSPAPSTASRGSSRASGGRGEGIAASARARRRSGAGGTRSST